MKAQSVKFDAHSSIENLKHFLPSQAPLKDFIHHNTLHAFQQSKFFDGLNQAHEIFGYKVLLTIDEYRELFKQNKIDVSVLDRIIRQEKKVHFDQWKDLVLNKSYDEQEEPRIGQLRASWKSYYKFDIDSLVHPTLFRIIGSYLDQGISIWNFPHTSKGFIDSIRELEKNSHISFFRTERVKSFLIKGNFMLESLLKIVVGDEKLYEQYLFDQQFAHPGWSGIVAVIESDENILIDSRKISLEEFIMFELLMEIDVLDDHFGAYWSPLALRIEQIPKALFEKTKESEISEVKRLWQMAFEWSYFDTVLLGIQKADHSTMIEKAPSFHALFCLDDRECSIRRYLEADDLNCATYGTAGFFGVEFYFQPEGSSFRTKVCPAPLNPKYLIKEFVKKGKSAKDFHFGKHSHGLLSGWFITHSVGFLSALKLMVSVFRPSKNAASVSSFAHMHPESGLTIENKGEKTEDGLHIGFTIDEMTDRLENLLRSIGLINNFGPIIYSIGHGSSSVNNTHYAGYDCGACSGRPGSVNARVISHIGNDPKVRKKLSERGIIIPPNTQFIGGLHDTSRDEIMFYDVEVLSEENKELFKKHNSLFCKALDQNSKERSRRFMSINTHNSARKIHKSVKKRTVSLFEPRPELNHATNALCIIGRREFTSNVFMDRRAFLNSFDYTSDPEGKYLFGILNAVAPVCGGINLEYYFSRVDNQQLGAGTKLPHNVMGLIGVANGIDGDLRTGLPSQMIEVHDPLRLMVVVEHFPDVVLESIKKNPATYEWFEKDWIILIAANPVSKEFYLFKDGRFELYQALDKTIPAISDFEELIESSHDNLPVHLIRKEAYGLVH